MEQVNIALKLLAETQNLLSDCKNEWLSAKTGVNLQRIIVCEEIVHKASEALAAALGNGG